MLANFLDRVWSYEIFRFLFIGGISTIIHVLALVIQMEVFSMQYASVANFIAALIALVFAYFGNLFLVFKVEPKVLKRSIVKFLFTYICIMLIHLIIPLLVADILGYYYMIALGLALIIHIPFSFLMNKLWVFK